MYHRTFLNLIINSTVSCILLTKLLRRVGLKQHSEIKVIVICTTATQAVVVVIKHGHQYLNINNLLDIAIA